MGDSTPSGKCLLAWALAVAGLAGCATELSQQGSKVRLLKEGEGKAEHCKQVTYIAVSLPVGSPEDARNEALNQSAEAGADALYIYFTWHDALRGSQLQGDAVRCGPVGQHQSS